MLRILTGLVVLAASIAVAACGDSSGENGGSAATVQGNAAEAAGTAPLGRPYP